MQLGSVNKPDSTVKKHLEGFKELPSKENSCGPHHFKTAGDVAAEHAGLQRFHVAADIGLRVHDVAVIGQLVEDLLLLVGEDDVGMEGLHHEQRFTQRAGALTQHLDVTKTKCQDDQPVVGIVWKSAGHANLIGLHGDDGAQSKDEGVNVLHVQVICGHGIRHRVGG